MIRYRFGHDDLLRTRFAISPLFEATASLAALRDPGAHGIHTPWVRATRERLRAGGPDLRALDALVSRGGYTPDFISPPPESPLPDVAAEIERVRRTPPEQVRREVGWRFEGRRPPAAVRPLLTEPRRGVRALADALAAYWELALAPVWERITAVLEDDIAHRARALTAGGPIEVFGDLHPQVAWRAGALEIDRDVEQAVDLGGRGLQLVPSVFIWPRSGAMLDPPWQPAVIYPPRGVGTLWEPRVRDPRALGALIGDRRAAILAALDREATTTAVARRLAASPASVSEHLGVLRRAGLVRGRRAGREVHYARTAAGDAILRASAQEMGASTG
jgi:DNA-binding transcriptional ArsR family regulator